jgi:hypothetical protein
MVPLRVILGFYSAPCRILVGCSKGVEKVGSGGLEEVLVVVSVCGKIFNSVEAYKVM